MTPGSTPLERLQLLAPAPKEPVENGPPALRRPAEAGLGLSLPEGIIEFATVYGSGSFRTHEWSGLLQIYNPFSPVFVSRVTDLAQACRDLKRAEGDGYIPYQIYPDKPGLLPFGSGEGERLLFWLTEGPPDAWPIVVSPADRSFLRFDLSIPAFLLKLFTGEIDCWGAGHDSAWFKSHTSEITFRPIKRRARS